MPKNVFSYRRGLLADLDQLKELAIKAYAEFIGVLTPANGVKWDNSLRNEEKLLELFNKSTCFVCLHEDRVVGMAFLVPRGNGWDMFKDEWSYIRMVGVDPAFRGQGIARTLTAMCIDHARQNREKTIALHTSVIMPAARHLYESMGFKVLQQIPDRYGKKYWLYTVDME